MLSAMARGQVGRARQSNENPPCPLVPRIHSHRKVGLVRISLSLYLYFCISIWRVGGLAGRQGARVCGTSTYRAVPYRI